MSPKPILVLNCGSSSVKYQMIDVASEEVLAKGAAERIGLELGKIEHETGGAAYTVELPLPDHVVTLNEIVKLFAEHGPDLSTAVAVAHRTVHGGEKFSAPTLITDEVIQTLVELSPLAPLHNPPGIDGIRAAIAALPGVPQVGIFDTAFFTALPPEAYTYAIDKELAGRLSIRKYGFHGTSHQYVSQLVAEFLGEPALRQIVCHLGNGASISAVNAGVPIDTTLGMTPVQGLVMGTRSGDVDPGLHKYVMTQTGMGIDEVDNMLNKHSGMLGMCGMNDMRDINAARDAGDRAAELAWKVYVHRVVFYVGAYHALLGGAQAITFTAGIGENDNRLRADVCHGLSALGVVLDEAANAERRKEPRVISSPTSQIKVLVVPTNEELAMARQAAALVG
jgi:acetate kinase